VHELIEARDEKRLLRLQRQLAGHKLLIVDELGYVPLSQTGAWVEARVWGTRIATRCRRLARLGKVGAAAKKCSPDARWMLSGLRRRVRKRSAGTNRDKQSPVLRHSNSQTISLAAVCRAHQNATIEKIDAPTSSFGWGALERPGLCSMGKSGTTLPYQKRVRQLNVRHNEAAQMGSLIAFLSWGQALTEPSGARFAMRRPAGSGAKFARPPRDVAGVGFAKWWRSAGARLSRKCSVGSGPFCRTGGAGWRVIADVREWGGYGPFDAQNGSYPPPPIGPLWS
jgi:hypothetical protein